MSTATIPAKLLVPAARADLDKFPDQVTKWLTAFAYSAAKRRRPHNIQMKDPCIERHGRGLGWVVRAARAGRPVYSSTLLGSWKHEGKTRKLLVMDHVMSMRMFRLNRDYITKGLQVCHKCENPRCMNPHHLYLGTPTHNSHDYQARGSWRSQYERGLWRPAPRWMYLAAAEEVPAWAESPEWQLEQAVEGGGVLAQ